MRALLHADLKLSASGLTDRAIGARYKLSQDSLWLLKQLAKDNRIDPLASSVARDKGLPERVAKEAIYNLLGQINAFGGVVLHWTKPPKAASLRPRLLWRERHPGTFRGFVSSMLRAYGWPVALATAIFAGIKIAGGNALPTLWAGLPVLMFLSCVAHEAGHALAAKKNSIPFVFLSHVGYTAILYVKPDVRTARRIAISGPLPAGLFYLALAVLPVAWPVRLSLGLAGLIQLLSLLPFCADGRNIWGKDGSS